MNKFLLIAVIGLAMIAFSNASILKEEREITNDNRKVHAIKAEMGDLKNIIGLQEQKKAEEAKIHKIDAQIHHFTQMLEEEMMMSSNDFLATSEPTDNYMGLLVDFFFN